MKTTNLNVGNRLYALPLLLAALLTIPTPGLVTSAETSQGKGGEVVAKPTSAKSRGTSKSTSRPAVRAPSLEGTVWDFKDGEGNEFSYEFLAEGKMKFSGPTRGEATWKQNGTRIVMTFGSRVEVGTISGNRMNGSGRWPEAGKLKPYRWNAKRNKENE